MSKLHVKLEVKDLIHCLNFANSIVEKSNILTAFRHIKLTASEKYIEVVATDMDLTLLQKIPAQIFEEGETVVPSANFVEIIRKISDKDIILKQEKGSELIEIIGSNCTFNLITLQGDTFPSFEDMNNSLFFKIQCREFVRIIENTQFSMSTDETRYNLNGVCLKSTTDSQNIIASTTDGHRLSIATCKIDKHCSESNIILPKKTVQEILKITKDSRNIDSELQVVLEPNKVKFLCNNISMISKLIDGDFPDCIQFIPKDNDNILKINSKILAASIDRVATLTIEKYRAVKIALDSKQIEISASSKDLGSAKEVLNINNESMSYTGAEMQIGFNPKYLLDVLSVAKQEDIEIYFKDSSSPTLIKLTKNSDDSFVIMPVKI